MLLNCKYLDFSGCGKDVIGAWEHWGITLRKNTYQPF
jgi:hypothetical protein